MLSGEPLGGPAFHLSAEKVTLKTVPHATPLLVAYDDTVWLSGSDEFTPDQPLQIVKGDRIIAQLRVPGVRRTISDMLFPKQLDNTKKISCSG